MKGEIKFATDREMMLEAVDIIRTVAGKQKGLRRIIGKLLNKTTYKYYKWIRVD